MDDAGGGRRGERAALSPDLARFLRRHWGVRPAGVGSDIGGSVNLNLLVTDGRSPLVARVYRPFVTAGRVAALQSVRGHLAVGGIPCPEPIPARGGGTVEIWAGRAVEVEPYVDAPAAMNTLPRIRAGLAVLGRSHALLRTFPPTPETATPRFANHVPAAGLVAAVAAGTRRIRRWRPTPPEARLADIADELAEFLATREDTGLRRQLVHGDFWDDNIGFRAGRIALVTDFDFAGVRPPVDDLALTLFFTSVDITDVAGDPGQLRELVGGYEQGLGARLGDGERAAIPLAMARQPLWSVAVWVAMLDGEPAARRHLAAAAGELAWARRFTGAIPAIQNALSRR